MKLAPFPSPHVLLKQWENGEIKREELHELMAKHQHALLEEAEEARQNPIAAYVEGLMNKRAAKKLINDHGEAPIREIFKAMTGLEDFPPSAYLWNADHWDVALHCFIRSKSTPVFRVKEIMVRSTRALLHIEYGSSKKKETIRERIALERHWKGEMQVVKREQL